MLAVEAPDGRWWRLNSGVDPIGEADGLISAPLSAGEPQTLVVIGLGLGYVLDAIERRSEHTRVLAVEPLQSCLRLMFERRDWSRWLDSGRLKVLAGPDYHGAAQAFTMLDPRAAPPTIVTHPVLARAFRQEVIDARRLVARIIKGAQANEEARRRFAGPYLLNTLQNLPVVCREGDVAALHQLLPGVPGVVVAAGPSLDRSLDDLRALQQRVLIIAVDTALRPLLAAGIRPHLVVAVDPQEVNARHLAGMTNADGVFLVAEGSLHPSAFRPFAGRTFCFKVSHHHPWPWLGEHGADRGGLRAWGSVLTTAFDLACIVGCDPIVFAGADLAYTDGLLYCRNTIYERKWSHLPTDAARAEAVKPRIANGPTTNEPDVRGVVVVSAPRFVQFRDWIVARAREASPRRVVNATGAGILHGPGIEQAELSSFAWPSRPSGSPDVRHQLAEARKASRSGCLESARRLARAIGQRDGAPVPVEAWLEFSGDGASADRIAAALDGARLLLPDAADERPHAHGSGATGARACAMVAEAAETGRQAPDVLGLCLMHGLLDEAEAVVRALHARGDGTIVDGLSRVAGEHKWAGRTQRAIDLLREEFQTGRQTAGWTVHYLRWLVSAGQTGEAEAVLETIPVDAIPSDTHWFSYAVSLSSLGRIDEAETVMRRLYSRNPALKDGLSLVARQACKAGRWSYALDLLRDDHREGRQTAGWSILLGKRLLDAGQANEALAVLASVSPVDNLQDEHRFSYAVSLHRLGRTTDAEATIRDLARRDGQYEARFRQSVGASAAQN